ncbi:hypothetical protein [Micromonospora sp. NBC_00858]|nr:hypothetical protein OG990_33905 [Micromonospora sp. NBC_00858]
MPQEWAAVPTLANGTLFDGMRSACRCGECRAMVTGISDRLLARQLKELE